MYYLLAFTRLTDTGLDILWLFDLALGIIYFSGYLSGYQVPAEIHAAQFLACQDLAIQV